ncbi:MAG: alpha-hydroxy-acid oxidizing protein [Bryobacteraceae bacterium]|jgi:isopentenyl diphosphate isomerase/L-lactate dehydrogenase-like FMN-dependent dehydrogenase
MSTAQSSIGEPPGRIAPVRELVNTFEFEAMAQRCLSAAAFAAIAGSDRSAFDRITLRPRMMVNTTQLDLTTELFGQRLFAPILVGPASEQKRFHPEGELASVRGASAAKTAMVVSGRASYPIKEIAAQPAATLWYQVYPEADTDAQRRRIDQAVDLGCKALCITIGGADWSAIDRLRQGLRIPVVLKGIMSPEEARAAIGKGIDGIVVSNCGGQPASGMAAPIEVLPAIAEAVAGKAPILIDGSFRRGADILKALVLGARAVMLGRPPLWALAAYGSAGVQTMLEMLQTELARDMAMCGKPNLKSLDPSLVKIHARGPSRP